MYFPYLRGKQFELIMLREMASSISEWGFVPIIEPVKSNFSPLRRAITSLVEHNCRFILIANPCVGDLRNNPTALHEEIIQDTLAEYENYSVGLCLKPTSGVSSAELIQMANSFFNTFEQSTAVIHDGFSDGAGLRAVIDEISPEITEHIFMHHSSTLYRRHFSDTNRILIEDGFDVLPNKDYPATEPFSELYLTYQDMGCNGFGDYLIVGKDFRDGGGPAGAVAIHVTYVDPSADNAIAVFHFISDMNDVLDDVAAKFAEALTKLVDAVEDRDSQIYRSRAIEQFMELHERGHYPGLGYVKKLSMQHHIELMAHILNPGG